MARHMPSMVVAAIMMASCSAEKPVPPAEPTQTENARAAITDYARLLMIEHKPEQAFRKYYADLLVQHDPWIGDGGSGDADFLQKRRAAEPEKYDDTDKYVTVIHNILADGDLVAIVSHVFTSPTDKGREFVDIWRMERGKFAEHWDIIRPIDPAQSAKVGCGVGGTYEAARQAGDTVAKPTCGSPDPATNSEASRKLVLERLKSAGNAGDAKVERLLADGDLVLVHSHVTGPGDPRGAAHADLFQVKEGAIVDHRQVVQPIPPFSASGRSMTGGPETPLEPGRVKRAPRPGE